MLNKKRIYSQSRRDFLGLLGGTAIACSFPGEFLAISNYKKREEDIRYSGQNEDIKEISLRIATWNICGLPILYTPRFIRMPLIGKTISERNIDIIGIQEAFFWEDREKIRSFLRRDYLDNSVYYPSRLGSGLLTLSKFPIIEKDFRIYQDQGNFLDSRMDWYVGKGVSFAKIKVNENLEINFFNTHIHGLYSKEDIYEDIRINQRKELVDYIEEKSFSDDNPIVLTSDLNCLEKSLEYEKFMNSGGLKRILNEKIGKKEHIHAREGKEWKIKEYSTEEIPRKITNAKISLSNHNGYISKIRIIKI